MYIFRSKTGTFTIGPDPMNSDLFELCIGGMWLASYETTEKAAEAVCLRCTGWYDWDRHEKSAAPANLSEWEVLE